MLLKNMNFLYGEYRVLWQYVTQAHIMPFIVATGMCVFLSSFYLYPIGESPKTAFYLSVVLPLLFFSILSFFLLFFKNYFYLFLPFSDKNSAEITVYVFKREKIGLLALLLCCWIWLSQFWSSQEFSIDLFKNIKRILMLALLFFGTCCLIQFPRMLQKLLIVLLMIGTVHAGFLVYEFASVLTNTKRLPDPTDTAMVYATLSLISIYLCFTTRKR